MKLEPQHNPAAIKEAQFRNPASALAQWLDRLDVLGGSIPTQVLTDKPLPHPLEFKGPNLYDHQINLQLAVLTLDLLNNPEYFDPAKVKILLSGIQNVTYEKGQSAWKISEFSPDHAVEKLVTKQSGYLGKGESWQFAKIGFEVNPLSQSVGYKLHAIQELVEPFASAGATQYEDQLADIFTEAIMARAEQFKTLAYAIGPYRFSIRWQDFLAGGENKALYAWIEKMFGGEMLSKKSEYPENLLEIAWAESKVTPGTIVQILKRKTFRSTGKVPALRPKDVADPHKHAIKVELYLPLMGPGTLKVQFNGEGPVHTYTPNPNTVADLDLSQLGAQMVDGTPTLFYKGQKYQPGPDGYIISVLLENGSSAQFIVVRPGDIHDFTNVGISPAAAFALTLGFPEKPGDLLTGDFIGIEDKSRLLK